jgi:hypothetical protein
MVAGGLPRLLLPALTTFAAGLLLGAQWVSRGPAESAGTLPPDLQAWHLGTVEALTLTPEQGEDLRLLLFHYSRQRDELLAARFAEVDPDWQALDLRFQTLLQTRILDGEQRRRAEHLRRARTLAAVAPPR